MRLGSEPRASRMLGKLFHQLSCALAQPAVLQAWDIPGSFLTNPTKQDKTNVHAEGDYVTSEVWKMTASESCSAEQRELQSAATVENSLAVSQNVKCEAITQPGSPISKDALRKMANIDSH